MAWDKYELCRRQLEAFLRQNAAGASSPSRAIVLPTPQPPAPLPLPPRLQTDTAPLSSPVPLTTASIMLAYNPSKGSDAAASAEPTSSTSAAPPIDLLNLGASANGVPFNLGDLGNGMDGMDLSTLGMAELSAIINVDSFPYSADGVGGLGMAGLAAGAGAGEGQAAVTPRTQAANDAATETFLASLTADPGPSASTAAAQAEDKSGGAATTGESSTASATNRNTGKTNATQAHAVANMSDFSFDMPPGMDGDVNLNDLSELAGLFDSGGALDAMSRPVSATSTKAPALQPAAEIKSQADASDKADPAANGGKATGGQAQQEGGADGAVGQTDPPKEGDKTEDQQAAGQYGEYDFNNIDLDDFNFGDSNLMNVEGDEFQSLLDEFN